MPTSRWRDGEYIRDRFAIRIPTKWRGGDTITIGLRMSSTGRERLTPKGEVRQGVPDLAVLGQVNYQAPTTPVLPAKPAGAEPRRLRPVQNP